MYHPARMCRLCSATDKRLISINDSTSESSLGTVYKIESLLAMKVEPNDKLPKTICTDCHKKLEEFYIFKLMCRKAAKKDPTELGPCTAPKKNDTSSDEAPMPIEESAKVHITNPLLPETEKVNSLKGKKGKEKGKKASNTQQCQCDFCGKLLSNKYRLALHIKIHTGEKLFKCKFCDKEFNLPYNLKVHEKSHLGEKPHTCIICQKKFAHSSGLAIHMRNHSGDLPFKCTICPKTFSSASNRHYHILVHANERKYSCKICASAFIRQGDLTRHLSTHSKERNFVCSTCGHEFSRKYHLQRHMAKHTGMQKYECDLCDKSYTQRGDLVRHRKKVHDEVEKKRGLSPSISIINI